MSVDPLCQLTPCVTRVRRSLSALLTEMPSLTASPNRLRSPYSLILTELRAIKKEIHDHKKNLPNLITEQLQLHDNQRKLVVSGLPEGTTREKVSQLLSLGGVPPGCVLTLVPLGRPRTSGPPRPICVELTTKTAVPHLKTLSETLKTSPVFSSCSVRLFETAQQRHEGYLKRQERRKSIATPEPQEIDTTLGLSPLPSKTADVTMEDEEIDEDCPVETARGKDESLLLDHSTLTSESCLTPSLVNNDNIPESVREPSSVVCQNHSLSLSSFPLTTTIINGTEYGSIADFCKLLYQGNSPSIVYRLFDTLPDELKRPVKKYVLDNFGFEIHRNV